MLYATSNYDYDLVFNSFDDQSSTTIAENQKYVNYLQKDSDQVFWTTDQKQLKSFNVETEKTEILLTDVVDFKVFEDDIIYATTKADGYRKESLWMSEGSAETTVELGTINGEIDFSNSVVVPTESWLMA